MRTVTNKVNGPVVLHSVIANTILVASNTADSGNLIYSELAATGEDANTIKGCAISKIWYGGPNTAGWVVKRQEHGNPTVNTVVVVVKGTGVADYAGHGVSIDINAAHDITITPVGTGVTNCYIMLELKKITGDPDITV